MTGMHLTLRVNRRAIAAAVLDDEQLTLVDGRYLPSHRDRATAAAVRYVTRLLEMTGLKRIAIEAAADDRSQGMAVLTAIRDLLKTRGLIVLEISIAEVLQAFGVPGLRSRRQLRETVTPLFTGLQPRGAIKEYVTDAAAAALFVETTVALGIPDP
jgi:hypothetical protein